MNSIDVWKRSHSANKVLWSGIRRVNVSLQYGCDWWLCPPNWSLVLRQEEFDTEQIGDLPKQNKGKNSLLKSRHCLLPPGCLKKLLTYLFNFLERIERRKRHRSVRETLMWLISCLPYIIWLGTDPATQASALTRNWTGDFLLCRTIPNQLSHPARASRLLLEATFQCQVCVPPSSFTKHFALH